MNFLENISNSVIFYNSEKSVGNWSILLISVEYQDEFVQNTLFHISSIFSKILFGSAYFSTSSHNNLPSTGKINIVKTVTIIPITAYLIVFIAGLILSSLPQESISNKPHQSINIIENIPAASTNIEIQSKIKSHISIFAQNIDVHDSTAYTVSKTIVDFYLVN